MVILILVLHSRYPFFFFFTLVFGDTALNNGSKKEKHLVPLNFSFNVPFSS